MPVSKRNKVVSLTKTSAKGRSLKTKYVESLRNALDEYEHVYVLKYENMRASHFKDVRSDWKESRLFLGKNSIAQIALGRTPEEEYKDNLRHISAQLGGNTGLLFTNRDRESTLKYFKEFVQEDYAKAGAMPDEDVIIPPGPLPFAVSMLDLFRKLGLIVEVENGVMMLREAYIAAAAGSVLTPEQAKVLAHMKKPLAEFRIQLVCGWNDGEFEEF